MTLNTLSGRCSSAVGCWLLVVLLVAGCGSSDGGDPTPSSGASSTPPAPAPAPRSAPPLVAEAGFIETPAALRGPTGVARMFYAFQPASHAPEQAPLVVLFNGGPGYATSGALLAFGTGRHSVDPGSIGVEPTPFAWSEFAHLLYLEHRFAGFSYGLGQPTCVEATDAERALVDAADFVFALLEFLDRHETLRDRRVVLVGESYGGTRGALMLHLLQNYAAPPTLDLEFPDVPALVPWLSARVQSHLDEARPDLAGRPATPAELAEQFGDLVFIQPNFSGKFEFDFQAPYVQSDPVINQYPSGNAYDVTLSDDEARMIELRVSKTLRQPPMVETLLGVPLASIPGLRASDRQGAYRPLTLGFLEDTVAEESLLRAELGELGAHDAYWQLQDNACGTYIGVPAVLEALLLLLPRTNVFITHAVFDSVVYTAALPHLLELSSYAVSVHDDQPSGAARPGVIELFAQETNSRVMIRFPTYEAGHMVTLRAGRELGEDVRDWLASNRVE